VTDYEKQELRSNWSGVYLDGRNEHGAHALPLPQGMIETPEPQDYAEEIMSAAEEAGHVAGDCVVTVWRFVAGDYSEGGFPPHYELAVPYHADLTAIIYGTPHEQKLERDRLESQLST